jgi:hypothetical protein
LPKQKIRPRLAVEGSKKPMEANALPWLVKSRSLHSSASRLATGAEVKLALDFLA